MLFPTESANDIVWLSVDEQFKIEQLSLGNDQINWKSKICNATEFSTDQQAQKFGRIAQELWHITFFKVLEINQWEVKQIKNLQ